MRIVKEFHSNDRLALFVSVRRGQIFFIEMQQLQMSELSIKLVTASHLTVSLDLCLDRLSVAICHCMNQNAWVDEITLTTLRYRDWDGATAKRFGKFKY